jgi:predicted Zn-dependent protease
LPYETDLYLNAAKMLLKMNRYIDALKILNKSLEYRETAFALQWIGQILLIHRKFKEGILYLEKARARGSTDIQLFYNLALAYFMTGNDKHANQIIEQLKIHYPDSPYWKKLKQFQSAQADIKNNSK